MTIEKQPVGASVPLVLAGAEFTLRPFHEQDICERYLGWLHDPDVTRYLEFRFVRQSRETAAAFVRSFYAETEKYIWGIYAQAEGLLIGTCTLYNINRHHGSGEVSIMVGDKSYWRRGAATEAVALMVEYAFGPLALRRVTAGSYSRNHGMNFTFKKLGFILEGTMRLAYEVGPREYVDGYRWGILADEWRERERAASR